MYAAYGVTYSLTLMHVAPRGGAGSGVTAREPFARCGCAHSPLQGAAYQSLLDRGRDESEITPEFTPEQVAPEFNPESRPRTTVTKHTRTHTLYAFTHAAEQHITSHHVATTDFDERRIR